MVKDSTRHLFDLFAGLLEYPTLVTPLKAGLCHEQLRVSHSEAGILLENFSREVKKRTLEQMQEVYTVTFDMQPICYPYIGYQLFGESYKRGSFMARLNEAYRASGFSAANELPDHITIILHFLALDPSKREDEFGTALLCKGLLPALKKMDETLRKQAGNPYADVVSALLCVLIATHEKEVEHA